MPKQIKVNLLSIKQFEKAQKQVREFRDSFVRKIPTFLQQLADVGIDTAYNSMGKYQGYVEFSKKMDGSDAIIVRAKDSELIKRVWRGGSAEVSPLWMAEFGSGWKSVILDETPPNGAGQGGFPGQTHAFSPNGWTWKDQEPFDENGQMGIHTGNGYIHTSYGESPTYPMYNAAMEMVAEVEKIAKEVFNGG